MRLLRGGVLFVGAMVLQWWWNSHLAYWGAAPQFLLTLTILTAARRGPVSAMILGWIWGLYVDTLRADLVGASALLYALAGYMTGIVRRQMDLRAAGPLAATVLLATCVYAVSLGLLGGIFLKSFVWVGWTSFILSPFLNAAFVVVASVAWDAWGDP